MRDKGVVMTFKHYIPRNGMGWDGMGCGTAAYKKTSRGGGGVE